MFVLTEMQDIVRIEPHRFTQDMGQQLTEELNKKFANKVSQLTIKMRHAIFHVTASGGFDCIRCKHMKALLVCICRWCTRWDCV